MGGSSKKRPQYPWRGESSSSPLHSPSGLSPTSLISCPRPPSPEVGKLCGRVYQASVLPQASRWVNPGLSKARGSPQTLPASNTEPPCVPAHSLQETLGAAIPGDPPAPLSLASPGPASPACQGHLQAPLGRAPKGDGQRRGPVRAASKSCCRDHPLKTQRDRDSLSPEPSPDGQSSVSGQRSRPVPPSQLPVSVSSEPKARSYHLHSGSSRSAVETHPSRVDPPLLTPQLQALAQPLALSSV